MTQYTVEHGGVFTETWEDSSWQDDWDFFATPANTTVDTSSDWTRSQYFTPYAGSYHGFFGGSAFSCAAKEDTSSLDDPVGVWVYIQSVSSGQSCGYGVFKGARISGSNYFDSGMVAYVYTYYSSGTKHYLYLKHWNQGSYSYTDMVSSTLLSLTANAWHYLELSFSGSTARSELFDSSLVSKGNRTATFDSDDHLGTYSGLVSYRATKYAAWDNYTQGGSSPITSSWAIYIKSEDSYLSQWALGRKYEFATLGAGNLANKDYWNMHNAARDDRGKVYCLVINKAVSTDNLYLYHGEPDYVQSGNWSVETVTTDTGGSSDAKTMASMTIGPDRKAHLIWVQYDSSQYRIKYCRYDLDTLTKDISDTTVAYYNAANNPEQPVIRCDTDGVAHIAWLQSGWGTNTGYKQVCYTSTGERTTDWPFTSTNPPNELITDEAFDHYNPCIDVNYPYDSVYVFWLGQGASGNPSIKNIRYKVFTTSWGTAQDATDESVDVKRFDMCIDVEQTDIHVAYTQDGELFYKRTDGGSWQTAESVYDGMQDVYGVAIAPHGEWGQDPKRPSILFHDGDSYDTHWIAIHDNSEFQFISLARSTLVRTQYGQGAGFFIPCTGLAYRFSGLGTEIVDDYIDNTPSTPTDHIYYQSWDIQKFPIMIHLPSSWDLEIVYNLTIPIDMDWAVNAIHPINVTSAWAILGQGTIPVGGAPSEWKILTQHTTELESAWDLTPLIYFSQKSGNRTGDSTVWNTARGGGGTAGVPGKNGWLVVQDGHTITVIEPGKDPHVLVEDGGIYDQAGFDIHRYGSLIVEEFGGYLEGGTWNYFHGTGIIEGLFGYQFKHLEFMEDSDYYFSQNTALKSKWDLKLRGTLKHIDHGVLIGSDDVVEVDDHANFKPGANEPFSIMMRFKIVGVSGWGDMVWKMDGSDQNGFHLEYHSSPDRITWQVDVGGTTRTATLNITLEEFRVYTLIAMRSALGYLHLYVGIDKSASSTNPVTGAVSNTNKLTLGNEYPYTGSADMEVLEFHYYKDLALSQFDVINKLENVNPETSPELLLMFNEGTGTAEDSSGNDHPVTFRNDVEWVYPEEWVIKAPLVTGPLSTVELASGRCKDLIYHGSLTIHPEHRAIYEREMAGSGTLLGLVSSTDYHSDPTTFTIDEEDFASELIDSVEIQRNPNKTTYCKLNMASSAFTKDVLLGLDQLKITQGGNTKFRGVIYERESEEEKVTLTAFDNLYPFRKYEVYRYLHGNLLQWKVFPIVGKGGSLERIELSGFLSQYFYPVVDITYLYTLAKFLYPFWADAYTVHVEVGYSDYASVIVDKRCAQYCESRDGGDILRVALYLGDRNGYDDLLRVAIWDLDEDSENYDTEILNFDLDFSGVPPTSAFSWVVYDVIQNIGRIKCPKKYKIVCGGEADGHTTNQGNFVHWGGGFIALNDPLAAKWNSTNNDDATEENLLWYNMEDDQGERSGIIMCHEVETMNDWYVKADPLLFDYRDTDIRYRDRPVDQPKFENITRKVSATEYDIVRVTAFYDGMTIDELTKEIVNRHGRWFFNAINVDNDNTQIAPYVLIEGSVGSALEKFIESWLGEFYHSVSGSNEAFVARASKVELDWSDYSAMEKQERTVMYDKDLVATDISVRWNLARLVSERYTESGKYIAQQMLFEQDSGSIPIFTRYGVGEPYFQKSDKRNGMVDGLFDLADNVLDELLDPVREGQIGLVDLPVTTYPLNHTNQLLKVVDRRTGWSSIMKTASIGDTFSGGRWQQNCQLVNVSKQKSPYDSLWWTDFFSKASKKASSRSIEHEGSLNLGDKYFQALEVNDLTYEDGDDDYWMLLGSNPTNPGTLTMQTPLATESHTAIIAQCKRYVKDGFAFLIAHITEKDMIGEWQDVFEIREIGIYKGTTKPAWTATLDSRVVLAEFSESATGFVEDLISSGEIYRAPIKFLYNSRLTVTFGCLDDGT